MEKKVEITDADRERLREPQGDVVQDSELIHELEQRSYSRLVTVGDRVSQDVARSSVHADIAVIDGRVQRELLDDASLQGFDPDRVVTAENPSGIITEKAWNGMREALSYRCPTLVDINGEEDLLALPAILFAPADAVIVYGQWDEGAVILEVDAALRQFAVDVLRHERREKVIVGGSWDQFHAGHRYILHTAFEHGHHVDVGVANDLMVREKLEHDMYDRVETRKAAVGEFLERHGYDRRADIVEISDFTGTAVDSGDALVVTPDTIANGRKINMARIHAGRTPLNLIEVDRIPAADGGDLSATRVRSDAIDRNGVPL